MRDAGKFHITFRISAMFSPPFAHLTIEFLIATIAQAFRIDAADQAA